MLNKDIKAFLFGLGLILFLGFISLPDTIDTIGKTFGIDTFDIVSDVKKTEIFYFRDLELDIWRIAKGTEDEFVKYALNAKYEELPSLKLESRGLVIDEEGNIVPKEYLGKLRPPYKFLIIGSSSILEGLGPQMERDLYTIPEMTVIREGKYSTGLNRKDYFNWYPHANRLIQVHQPDAVIVEFGGNDGQAIRNEKNELIQLSDSRWDEVYEDRIREFMRIVSNGPKKVYWFELPIPRTTEFQNKFSRINKIYEKVAEEYENVTYIKTWDRFTVNGKYTNSIQDDFGNWGIAKYSDGIHFTPFGSKIFSKLLMDQLKLDIIEPENN